MDSYSRGALTFDVLDGGPAGGEPVVLLHGFPQSNRSWDALSPRLQDAGFRTLAPNQRGYSPGARPRGRSAYALSELVDDVVALLDAEQLDAAHIVGHDWGAVVAWALAGAHPGRVRTLTALSVPHTAAFLRACARAGQLPHSWYMGAFQLPLLPERLLSPASTAGRTRFVRLLTGSGLPRASAERDAELLAGPGAMSGALGWYRALPLADRALSRRPVTVPTTYVWSDGDAFLTRAAAEACGRYVEAPYRFEILTGVDHWIPENAVEELTPLVLERLAG